MVKPTAGFSYSFGRLFLKLFWRVHSIEGWHFICFHMDASLSNRKQLKPAKMVYIYIVYLLLHRPANIADGREGSCSDGQCHSRCCCRRRQCKSLLVLRASSTISSNFLQTLLSTHRVAYRVKCDPSQITTLKFSRKDLYQRANVLQTLKFSRKDFYQRANVLQYVQRSTSQLIVANNIIFAHRNHTDTFLVLSTHHSCFTTSPEIATHCAP